MKSVFCPPKNEILVMILLIIPRTVFCSFKTVTYLSQIPIQYIYSWLHYFLLWLQSIGLLHSLLMGQPLMEKQQYLKKIHNLRLYYHVLRTAKPSLVINFRVAKNDISLVHNLLRTAALSAFNWRLPLFHNRTVTDSRMYKKNVPDHSKCYMPHELSHDIHDLCHKHGRSPTVLVCSWYTDSRSNLKHI